MSFTIKRRRFGHLAIASAITTIASSIASQSLAQHSSMLVYGIRLDSSRSKKNIGLGQRWTPSLILSTLDLGNGAKFAEIAVPTTAIDNSVEALSETRESDERLTGLTRQADGTLVISTVTTTRNGNTNNLIFIEPQGSTLKVRAKQVLGLQSSNTLESIAVVGNGQLLGITSLTYGLPPFTLTTIDLGTSRAIMNEQSAPIPGAGALPLLKHGSRYGNLAESPTGSLYATTLGSEGGVPSLVQIDLTAQATQKISKLSINGKPLGNDVLDLAFSPSGQLLALAKLSGQGEAALFTVDVTTGNMSLLKPFPARKIIVG
jgi:hypothetical protein